MEVFIFSRIIFLLLLLFSIFSVGHSSTGDRSQEFQRCIQSCQNQLQFNFKYPANFQGKQISQHQIPCSCQNEEKQQLYNLTRLVWEAIWNCKDECQYFCMEAIEVYNKQVAIHQGQTQSLSSIRQKYFGKWPFKRVLGAQELVSSIASLMNLVMHYQCFKKIKQLCQELLNGRDQSQVSGEILKNNDSKKLKPQLRSLNQDKIKSYLHYLRLYVYVNYGAWISSAIFHFRDTYMTEKIDYFWAILTLFYGLFLSCARLSEFNKDSILRYKVFTFGAFGFHFWRMLFLKFDYGFNMKICIGVGILAQLIWCRVVSKYSNYPNRLDFIIFLVGLNLAMGLEIFDFPPIYELVDAHALWHIATIFIVPYFYKFIQTDLKFLSQLNFSKQ